ncbi:hypothetical protein BKA62DRAFT_188530 [Auriculariales sp. MPI-PUGE-AT-0066]|nr:hypothetical protein BKA62DRAFT_188530 [Auriculariales sp. MPI-PUGE-AT-0066]
MKRFGDTRRLPEQLISHDHPEEHEHTRKRNWLARNLLRSLPGRVVMSAYSTSVTKATLVNCLSPWGDDDFVILPNVRVRDLFILAVTSSMNIPGSDFITDFIYETLVEEILETEIARIQRMIEGRRPEEDHFQRFLDVGMAIHTDIVTTAVKTLTLRLRYDHLMKDAALGMFP